MAESNAAFFDHASRAADQYRALYETYACCARQIEDLLTRWLDAEGINYLAISARAKSVESFRTKAGRLSDDGRAPRYSDPLVEITDLIGARVITYLPESVDRTCEILRTELSVEEDVDKGERTRQRGGFGYASRHFLVRLDQGRAGSREYRSIGEKVFEVQVRTAAQHAWAEFEHDVRYKVAIPVDRKPEFDRRFTLAAALMELADSEFTEIDRLYREVAQQSVQEARSQKIPRPRERDRPRQSPGDQPPSEASLDAAGLATWLAERYPDAPKSRREHYVWMVDILRTCDIATLDDLDRALERIDMTAVSEAMRHQFPAGHVRRLDDDLLAALGDAYVARSAAVEDRTELLQRRLVKLRRRRTSP
jgi:putative GTP pyrophosphokinase